MLGEQHCSGQVSALGDRGNSVVSNDRPFLSPMYGCCLYYYRQLDDQRGIGLDEADAQYVRDRSGLDGFDLGGTKVPQVITRQAMDVSTLKGILATGNAAFSGSQQQDAQEVFTSCMNQLEAEMLLLRPQPQVVLQSLRLLGPMRSYVHYCRLVHISRVAWRCSTRAWTASFSTS